MNVILFLQKIILENFNIQIEGRVERPVPRKSETYEDISSIDEFYLEIEIENYYLKNAIEQLSPMENEDLKKRINQLENELNELIKI
jgi:hypothetical protein